MGIRTPHYFVGAMGRHYIVPLLLLVSSGSAAQESFLCTSLWPSGDLNDHVGAMPCEELRVTDERLLAMEGQFRVFSVPGWLSTAERAAIMQRTIDAVVDTLQVFDLIGRRAGLEPVTAINIILGVEDYRMWETGSRAEVGSVADISFGDICPILVDGTEARLDAPDVYKQVIAHELFHCLQSSNQQDLEEFNAWWIEGAAEYAGNVVYPEPQLEHELSDLYNPSKRPVDHISQVSEEANAYATVTFFQHLENIESPDYVFEHVFNLPRDGNEDDFHTALSSWPGIAEHFHSFAEHYADNKIFDSNLRTGDGTTRAVLPIGPTPAQERRPIVAATGSQSIILTAESFTFELHPVWLQPGAEYEISIESNDTPGMLTSKRWGVETDAAWAELPERVTTGCNERDVDYVLLPTSTATPAQAAESYEVIVTFDIQAREECAPLLDSISRNCRAETGGAILDECVVGTWQMARESLVESHYGGPSRAPDRFLTPSGSIVVAFDGTGTFIKKYDASFDFVRYRSAESREALTQTTTSYQGYVGGCLVSESAPGMVFLSITGDLIDEVSVSTTGIRDIVFAVDRTQQGTPWNQWPRLQSRGRITYSCEGDTLKIGKREFFRVY